MIPLCTTTSLEINTTVTVISIICTFLTGIWAKRTKKIKNELQQKLNSYELVSYKDRLHDLYIKLTKIIRQNTIRQKEWNKGGKSNEILLSLEENLRDFNKFNKKMPVDKQDNIKVKIASALSRLDSVYKGYDYDTQNLLTDLYEIDDNLNSICNDLMSK